MWKVKQAILGGAAPCDSALERYSCLDHRSALGRKRFLSVKRALGGFVAPSRVVMEGGGGVEWEEVAETPPDRRAEGARPVGSHHGSYQCVWYGFGPQMGRHMCHAGWLS